MTSTAIAKPSRARLRAALAGVAAATVVGGFAMGPAASAFAAEAPVNLIGTAIALPHDGAVQPNGWYCGPAASRVALTSMGIAPSFDALAGDLGTTTGGTNSIHDVTRVLNKYLPDKYVSTEIGGTKASDEQIEKLRTDMMASVDQGNPMVANIVGTFQDTDGQWHSYNGGHYLTVTGYEDGGYRARITDPADFDGDNEYVMSVRDLAHWIAGRGYSS